jgi:hypothetical protein
MIEGLKPARSQHRATPWDELAGVFDDFDGDERYREPSPGGRGTRQRRERITPRRPERHR